MTPPGAKSARAREIPRPLTPGNWLSNAVVTAALMRFVVLPVMPSPE